MRSNGLADVVGEGPEAKAVLGVKRSAEVFSSQGFTPLRTGARNSQTGLPLNSEQRPITGQNQPMLFVALHGDLSSGGFLPTKT